MQVTESSLYFDSIVKEVKGKLEEYIKLSGREVESNGSFRCMMSQQHTNNDESWSANVNVKNGTPVWYCQVCKVGGTIFDLAHLSEGMLIHGEGFKRTVLELAARLNVLVDMSIFPASPAASQEFSVHSMLDMYREIESYLHKHGDGAKHLMGGEFGRTYSQDQAQKACELVPMGVVTSEDLTSHMKSRFGERIKDLPFYEPGKDSLATYVFNENRLALSVRDRLGRPVAFSGRVKSALCSKELPKDSRLAKYIHTKGFESIKKSTLFMIDQAKGAIKDKHEVKVVEGQFDTIAMHLAGFTNTVGMLGSNLTQEAIDLLLVPQNVYKMIQIVDGDRAGVQAVKRSLEVLKNYDVVVTAVALPEDEDPDSIFTSGDLSPLSAEIDATKLVLSRDHTMHDPVKPAEKRFKEMIGFIVSVCPFTIRYRDYAEFIGKYFGYHTDDIMASIVSYRNSDSKIIQEENKVMRRMKESFDLPIQDKIMVVERSLEDLKSLSASSRPVKKRTTWDDFTMLTSGKKEFPRVLDTGIRALDRHSDIEVGSLTFMAGYPSNGKSSVLQYLALKLMSAHEDLKVLYVSTDDIPEKPMSSMVSIITGIPKKDVRTMITEGTIMNQPQMSSHLEEIHHLFSERILIRGIEDCNSVPSIRAEMEDLAREHSGPILTVVDAMNDLKEMSVPDQRVGLESIIRDFKGMAPSYHSALIAVSHLTKQAGEQKRPILRDLKGSSFIEFAAKTIFLVHMDMHYSPETEMAWREQGVTAGESFPVVEVQTAKDKDNKAAEIAYLHFNPHVGTFKEPNAGLVKTYEGVVRNANKRGGDSGASPEEGIGGDFF